MIHLTQQHFDQVFGPHAHVAKVLDFGAVRIDLPTDQPPFIGLVLTLEHRELIGAPFDQLIKIPDELLRPLVELLTAHLQGIEDA